MKAPDHIKGTMKSTVASFQARVDRWRWIADHFEKGATYQQMARALGVSRQTVQDTLKRGDPSKTWHHLAKTGRGVGPSHQARPFRTPAIVETPWDHDGERPALDPRLTMARIVSTPRRSDVEEVIATIRQCRDEMRAGA